MYFSSGNFPYHLFSVLFLHYKNAAGKNRYRLPKKSGRECLFPAALGYV